jgi:glycosyltransferase involved in cell wall biosynthesis
MKILFIHQNFPGQFVHLAKELAARGHEVRALSINGKGSVVGVEHTQYKPAKSNTKDVHPLALEFETKVIRAEACARKMLEFKESGFYPDLIVAHPGWGESLLCKDVYPDSKLVHFVEFHYGKKPDVGFDPEFPATNQEVFWKMRVKDTANFMGLDSMDLGISPTHWQRNTAPNYLHSKIEVVFDGVDSQELVPEKQAFIKFNTPNGESKLTAGDEIITFINRNLEPYRGYHSFMRALPKILEARPKAIVLIVGGDKVSYGAKAPLGKTWKDIFLQEVKDKIDLSRVYFLGTIPREAFIKVVQISACHIYLTYPFVLSWSCVEAMSMGALMVGSKTEPVEEFIQHGKNGLLVDFFDYDELADTVIDCLKNPKKYESLRVAARESVIEKYDLKTVCLPRQIQLLESVLGKPL